MNKLLDALDKIIIDLDNLSAEEIQTKLNSHKGGLVGGAILNSHNCIRKWLEIDNIQFVMTNGVNHNETFALAESMSMFRILDDVAIKPATSNDNNYLMAA